MYHFSMLSHVLHENHPHRHDRLILWPTRVGNHPATVLETFGCWPRFWVCLNLFDLSDVVNITCIVHYGIEINIHTYIHDRNTPQIYISTVSMIIYAAAYHLISDYQYKKLKSTLNKGERD